MSQQQHSNYKDFKVALNDTTVEIIKGENSVSIPLQEKTNVIELINIAMRLSGQEMLPPQVVQGNIEIAFSDEGSCILTYILGHGSLPFNFNEADTLITIFKSAEAAYRLRETLKGRPRTYGAPPVQGGLV